MPRTGSQALTLIINSIPNTFAGAFQDVSVNSGNTYTFSGWSAASGALMLGVEVRIEWRDNTSEISRTPNLVPTPGNGTYTPFSLESMAPSGATLARVVYAVQSFIPGLTNGTVHVDDLSFEAVPEPSSAAMLATGSLFLLRRRRK